MHLPIQYINQLVKKDNFIFRIGRLSGFCNQKEFQDAGSDGKNGDIRANRTGGQGY
jgi:hypothetical protein